MYMIENMALCAIPPGRAGYGPGTVRVGFLPVPVLVQYRTVGSRGNALGLSSKPLPLVLVRTATAPQNLRLRYISSL